MDKINEVTAYVEASGDPMMLADPIIAKEDLSPDLKVAQRFLTLLDEGEDAFTFQVIPEREGCKRKPNIFHGSLEEVSEALVNSNQGGCGIFVTINRTDGRGRKTENIVSVRAVFVDLDGSPLEPIYQAPIAPHIIIETSPGRYHAYWVVRDVSLNEFELIQESLATRFSGDHTVKDLPRCMRLPGFYHQKGEPFQSGIIEETFVQPVSIEEFKKAFDTGSEKTEAHQEPNFSQENEVLQALRKQGMIISLLSHPKGCWNIRCPWAHLHTKDDLGTKYYEPNTNGYPNHGFQCFHKHCEHRTIYDLAGYLNVSIHESMVPIPLYRAIDKPKLYPVKSLGPVLAAAVDSLHRVIRAPMAVCAQSVLATAALVTQPFANVLLDGREIPLSSFFITVAESGDRKSAADKVALKVVQVWQKMLSESYIEQFISYEIEKQAWDIRKKEALNQKDSFNELPPVPPLLPLILVEEPTYEGIVKYLAEGQPSIGLFSDEGGRFFGGYAMSYDHALKTISGLCSLWDGKSITRMRAGDGNMVLYGRRFSLHLMIQEGILQKLMANDLIDEQGFLPRCLIAFPESMVGNRPYVSEDLTGDQEIIDYWEAMRKLLDRPLPINPSISLPNELVLPSILLSDQAKIIWIEYHNRIDKESASGRRLHVIRRFASKSAEHVLRLAGIMTLVEDPETKIIEVSHIKRAIELIDYYIDERLRIQGYLTISLDLRQASELLNWCWERGKSQVSLTECYQYGPSSIRTSTHARKIMTILVNHGWAVPTPDAVIDGKKYKEAWLIKTQ